MADTAYNYPHRSDVRLPPYNMTAGVSCRTLHFAQQTSIFDAKPLRFYLPMRIDRANDGHRQIKTLCRNRENAVWNQRIGRHILRFHKHHVADTG